MYQLNDHNWPVVIFNFHGPQTLAEHEQNLADWNTQFLREESFVAIRIFHDEESLVHPDGVGQVTKAWLRDGAAQSIKTSVIAMLNVVPDTAYDRMKRMSVESVFGVPGGIFKRYQDAITWFYENSKSDIALKIQSENFL